MTVADSENGDVHGVSPRHRLLGDSDTESLSDGVSIASVHSTVEEVSSVEIVHDMRTVRQSGNRSCLSKQSICTPFSPSEHQ